MDRQSNSFFCISANPAIDTRMLMARLVPGRVNRASKVRSAPGGKAAHVAMVLKALGADPLWIGTAGGRTGQQLLEGFQNIGIRVHAEEVAPPTRENFEIIDEQGCVTEILQPGYALTARNWEDFGLACDRLFSAEESSATVIASGSLPPGTDPNFYAELTELAHRRGHRVCLDASGEPLKRALAARPEFIKPNRDEAENLTGQRITDRATAERSAEWFIRLGAQSVVLSLGGEGFIWHRSSGHEVYQAQSETVKERSSVGCGDATVAAFAFATAMGLGAEETLRLAAACGTANCLAASPGRVIETDIRRLQPGVRVEKLA
jgi:tagatose 6-phosphate kinase